ncbi:Ribonuclease/ribotoxin [Byssothecium circinans]|uniref:ribonuclease T1 n=1 Tax=Byssothecium circinans TaxID=147558 RepID=A0A6A5UDX1_9PLEO|nr:Ribonuclease/ribotoxin [Byssothecium circinans]
MKYSSAIFLALLGATSALPAELESRAVTNDPISFTNGPSLTQSFTCGGIKYTGKDIYNAAQKGTNLHIGKETRGKKLYPHPFDKNDSKGVKLVFPKECPADKDRYEYPLKKNSVYDGGKSNQSQGDERVVFYYEDGEVDDKKVNKVYYCGIMTHKGAAPGGFVLC